MYCYRNKHWSFFLPFILDNSLNNIITDSYLQIRLIYDVAKVIQTCVYMFMDNFV